MQKSLKKYYNCFFIILILEILLIPLFIIQYYICNNEPSLTQLYSYELFVTYISIYIASIKRKGLLDIYSLYLFTLGVFLFGRVFLSILSKDYDIRYLDSLVNIKFEDFIIQKTISIYIIFLILCDVFYRLFNRNPNAQCNTSKITVKPNINYEILSKKSMLLLFPFALYEAYLLFENLKDNRALLFLEGSAGIEIPLVLKMTSAFFTASYMLFIASYPPKKTFILYSILYMIPIIPSLAIGNRMMIVTSLLFILWYIQRMYGYKIKTSKLLLFGFSIAICLQLVAFYRDAQEVDVSLSQLLVLFFKSQSISFYVLSLMISYENVLINNAYPYMIDSMISGFMITGQSTEAIMSRSSLGHHLTYSINPDYYFSGFSIGTSYIAEIYEFGLLGLLIGAFLLILFLTLLDKKMMTNKFFIPFSMMFFYNIISSPRGSLLPSIYIILKFTILMVFIIIVGQKLNKIRIK